MLKSILLVLVCATAVQAQTGDEKAVGDQIEKLRVAMIRPERAVLESLVAAELSYGHSSGTVEDKDGFVSALVTGRSVFTAIALRDQTIKITGDAAIVRHRLTGDTFVNKVVGKIDIYVLMVWRKESGSWKLLARQGVKVPPEK